MAKATTKAGDRRKRILDAAARLFREKGYAAVSLRAIAASQGMQGGSLYYHFDSKEQIVTEVLNTGIELVRVAVEYAVSILPRSASHADIIRTAVRVHLSALLEYSDYTSANVRIFGQVPASVQAANLATRANYEACWRRLLSDARRDGAIRPGADLNIARLALIGAMNASLEWFDPAQGSVDQLAERLVENFLFGIMPSSNR
jgi:AcrR family transcriptional regulator